MRAGPHPINHISLSRRAVIGGLAGGMLLGRSARPAVASAGEGRWRDLETDPAAWQVWIDPGDAGSEAVFFDPPQAVEDTAGSALRLAITGGRRPYTHIHCYRTLDPLPRATHVVLKMSWKFSDTTWNNEGGASAIQMIEPAMNVWTGAERYEWALQWQNVSDGSKHGEDAPAWRIWNGASWEGIRFSQRLEPHRWHRLTLTGSIEDGQVRYGRMISDDVEIPLPYQFPATPALEPARSAVTMQLGGNFRQDPYWCLVRNVSLSWRQAS